MCNAPKNILTLATTEGYWVEAPPHLPAGNHHFRYSPLITLIGLYSFSSLEISDDGLRGTNMADIF